MKSNRRAGLIGMTIILSATVGFSGTDSEDIGDVNAVVRHYNEAILAGNYKSLRGTISEQFMMSNLSTRGDKTTWEPHMFLSGDDIAEWTRDFIKMTAPHQNKVSILSSQQNTDAAIVVTSETGSNKFRSWTNERVTYFLGRQNNEWKILAYVIEDIQQQSQNN